LNNRNSLILFNAERCKALNPDYGFNAKGLELHRFHRLNNDHAIGSLPLERWNHLVDFRIPPPAPGSALLHLTMSGPLVA